MGDVNKFMASGDNINLAALPTSGHYDAEASFVLVGDRKGAFHLKGGTVTWNAGNRAQLTLSSADGNVHKFDDDFHGEGSAPLDSQTSSITLDVSKRDQVDFDVEIRHEMPIRGKSLWSAMAGHFVFQLEENAGTQTWTAQMLGITYPPDRQEGEPGYGGISYSRTGAADSIFSYSEMWTDAWGSSVLVEYELYAECEVLVRTPRERDELVFNAAKPGRIDTVATADMTPRFWSYALKWAFPDIPGSDRAPAPADAVGDSVPYSYTRLPKDNKAFDFHKVPVTVTSAKARAAGCKDPAPRPVGFFFDRKAENNPGPARPSPKYRAKAKDTDPNWFYYWKQTAAAQGHASALRYDGACLREPVLDKQGKPTGDIAVELGYYEDGDEFINVCDLGLVNFNRPPEAFMPGPNRNGIDAFAVTVAHEWKHHDNYWQYTRFKNVHSGGTDEDPLPGGMEPGIPVPAVLTASTARFAAKKRPVPTKFDPDLTDTFLTGYDDEHALAYAAEATWKLRAADKEDWACPGHQAVSARCAK